jgi:transcription antitermination factor NusG
MDKQWYVVYTKPRAENKVSEILARKKIENFLPINRIVTHIDNKRITYKPLFTCYIFTRVQKKQLAELKKIPGLINMVYWLGRPVVVPDGEITMIKEFLNDHMNINIEKITPGNEAARKYDSSLVEQEGSVITFKNTREYLILPSIGYKMTAEVETSNVRIIPSNNILASPAKLPGKLFNQFNFNNLFKN